MTILLYGATGYTGKLIAREAKAQGVDIILSGRDAAKLSALSSELGYDFRAMDLSNTDGLKKMLSDISVVLHIAGPFSATAEPMLNACLATGTHYIDITGEIAIFERHAALSKKAAAKGVMVMSGAGFDVVPTDCMAAYAKQQLPDATHLVLAVGGDFRPSRGTAKTGAESAGTGTKQRRKGKIITIKKTPRMDLDFGNGIESAIGMSWGDVSTAYHTTGIPNIEVYFQSSPQLEQVASLGFLARMFVRTSLGQALIKKQIDKGPEGPSEEERLNGRTIVLAIAKNGKGDMFSTRLDCMEGYRLTSMTALDIARRIDQGESKPGFQTPAGLFGADYVLQFENTSRQDL